MSTELSAGRGILPGMSYVAIGFRLIRKPGLRRFVLVPLLINLLIFGGMGWWLTGMANEWISGWSLFDRFADIWLFSAIETVLRWLFSIVLLLALAWFFTLLANLIGAPFNGLLAERVEGYLTNTRVSNDPGWLSMVKSMPRLMGSELAKIIYLIAWLIPLFLLHYVPLIQIVAPILLFVFGAWMFALEYLDYPLGNHGALFGDVREAARTRRQTAFGFGVVVSALSIVPIVNLFVMPVAVAGATALYVDHLRSDTTLDG